MNTMQDCSLQPHNISVTKVLSIFLDKGVSNLLLLLCIFRGLKCTYGEYCCAAQMVFGIIRAFALFSD